jgi:hypothetical protein
MLWLTLIRRLADFHRLVVVCLVLGLSGAVSAQDVLPGQTLDLSDGAPPLVIGTDYPPVF